MPSLKQLRTRFRIGERQIQIDFGELLFPAITLIFCVAYFMDSRGLPDQSMFYAQWLLYITALLAVITLLTHAVSVNSGESHTTHDTAATEEQTKPPDRDIADENEPTDEMVTDTATEAASETGEGEGEIKNEHFNLRTTVGLVILSVSYFASLNFIPFVMSSILFLAITLYMFGERSPIRIIAYSVGFTILLWAVFINWLQVPLP